MTQENTKEWEEFEGVFIRMLQGLYGGEEMELGAKKIIKSFIRRNFIPKSEASAVVEDTLEKYLLGGYKASEIKDGEIKMTFGAYKEMVSDLKSKLGI